MIVPQKEGDIEEHRSLASICVQWVLIDYVFYTFYPLDRHITYKERELDKLENSKYNIFFFSDFSVRKLDKST